MALSFRIQVKRSLINGRGAFTLDDIPNGVRVMKCQGQIRKSHELDDVSRIMQIGPDRYLVENTADPSVDDFLNHSCNPNIGFTRGTLNLYALRAIPARSELLIDYSATMNESGWKVRCRCRTTNCRRWIKSFCDLSARQQKQLAPIALRYLRST
jgi:SET domain-containing protein